MEKFTMYGKLTAQPGKRDELVQILLEAAEGLRDYEGCLLYIVNVSDEEPDAVWVTELWTNAEAHAASLKNEAAMEQIKRARPIIASVDNPIRLRPVGGKGL
ncbi:putative quinol monooxygenase [Paenibacillus arenilitoris]|uniref:Antibiotic biosynthesis monooxygenase n=1 Tax=Paenibacillus arenilitoris TaxID=2772299 RepID=A0A927CIP5_9BACL|nr:putative quinol monooxygenase [Paenibacillus arenilitoris]MBD2867353.1 antibiotic biosynthesis monooxygenase [Paenibacillus arenilitoris]